MMGFALARRNAENRDVLVPEEIMDRLELSKNVVYTLLARGEIPGARRFGSTWRIDRATFDKWRESWGESPTARHSAAQRRRKRRPTP